MPLPSVDGCGDASSGSTVHLLPSKAVKMSPSHLPGVGKQASVKSPE